MFWYGEKRQIPPCGVVVFFPRHTTQQKTAHKGRFFIGWGGRMGSLHFAAASSQVRRYFRLACSSLSNLLSLKVQISHLSQQKTAHKGRFFVGWGGRIRTYECRHQKPMPYHLATPQQVFCFWQSYM